MLRCIVIGACAVKFLHYVPLYRNIQHYATLNCSIKTYNLAINKTLPYGKTVHEKSIECLNGKKEIRERGLIFAECRKNFIYYHIFPQFWTRDIYKVLIKFKDKNVDT